MKRIYAQPIVTNQDVYRLEVFLKYRLKQPKFYIVVTGSDDDLKVCEWYHTYDVVRFRIKEIEQELIFGDIV